MRLWLLSAREGIRRHTKVCGVKNDENSRVVKPPSTGVWCRFLGLSIDLAFISIEDDDGFLWKNFIIWRGIFFDFLERLAYVGQL